MALLGENDKTNPILGISVVFTVEHIFDMCQV